MPAPDKPLDPNMLLIGLINILAGGNALAIQFERLAQEMGVPDGAPAIVFLSGMKKIIRELPDKVFADKNARLAMVDAVQDALDRAIEIEEDLQDQQDGGKH